MKINENIAISDSGFIFNASNGDSFSANKMAVEVIQLIKTGISKTEVVEKIATKYSVEEATVEQDVNDFYAMLESFNLLNNE